MESDRKGLRRALVRGSNLDRFIEQEENVRGMGELKQRRVSGGGGGQGTG